MANAKINVLILTHLSRTNIARFLRRRFRRFGFVLKFEISIPSCFILFFSRVFGQMGQRAEGGKRGVRKMCVSKRELIYLVISSGLLEGKMHGISSTRRKRNSIVNLNAKKGGKL